MRYSSLARSRLISKESFTTERSIRPSILITIAQISARYGGKRPSPNRARAPSI
jgi:hypothetical protein